MHSIFVSIDDYFIPSRPFLLSILFQMLLETLKAQEAVEHNGLQIKTTPIFRLGVIPLLLGGETCTLQRWIRA